MRTLVLFLASSMSLAGQLAAQSRPSAATIDWWEIDKAVVERLLSEDIDAVVGSLAAAQTPRDTGGWLRCLNILVRAGHREQAAKAIDRRAVAFPLQEKPALSHAADFLIERQEWDLARRFLERMPEAEPGWGYILVGHWAKTGSHAEIDRWLAARAKSNPEYWFRERLRFRAELGTENELLISLAADVRAHACDLARAERYLEAVGLVGRETDLGWMGQTCKPRLAYESFKLGSALARRSPPAAIALLERSLATPFTHQDQKLIDEEVRHWMAAVVPQRVWDRDLRLWAKQALAASYQANGQAGKAQPLVEALAAANKSGLPHYSWAQFAGGVQDQSGARVIEDRILKAEAANPDSSEYWLTRAKYYAGRKENAQAIEAFEKALALAPFDSSNETRMAQRHQIMREYAHYKFTTAGNHEAVRTLQRELAVIPLDTQYASWLIQGMLEYERDDFKPIHPGSEQLWSYLSARRKWDHAEERLLWRMVANVPESEREAHWIRAVSLVGNADPTRAKTLGWIMTRTNESARAIPLLKDAASRLPEGDAKKAATFTLFEAYCATNNWRESETLWPAVIQRLSPREIPDWLGKISVVAARAGAPDDAMRLWRAKANLDRTDLRALDELARLGLKERLRAFYEQIKKSDLQTWVPDSALKLLQ